MLILSAPLLLLERVRKKERKKGEGAAEMVVERDIDDLPKNDANYTALTPLWFLERAAMVHPTRKSVVHGSLHYTWLQTYQRCRRMASALNNHSVGFGSTVLDPTLFLSFRCDFRLLYKKVVKKEIEKATDFITIDHDRPYQIAKLA